MIMASIEKLSPRQTALALFAAVAFAVPSVQAAPRWQYVREVNQALPSGMSFSNAPSEAYQAAIQKVILAHPASEAAAIAGALATGATLERAKEISEAIGKLFPSHPDLAAQAVEIAREITLALNRKLREREVDPKGAAEPVPLTPEMVATEIGNVAAILAYSLDANNPESQTAIIALIQGVVLVDPQIDYTAKVVEIFIASLRSLGVPEALLDNVETGVLTVIGDPVIREQIRASLQRLKGDEVMFPPGFIIRQETPVTNG